MLYCIDQGSCILRVCSKKHILQLIVSPVALWDFHSRLFQKDNKGCLQSPLTDYFTSCTCKPIVIFRALLCVLTDNLKHFCWSVLVSPVSHNFFVFLVCLVFIFLYFKLPSYLRHCGLYCCQVVFAHFFLSPGKCSV